MIPAMDSGTIRELMDLSHINASLRSRGVKGKLDIKKERLFLRGTFAAADGTRKDRRVPLGLPANPGQLLQAETRVMALMAAVEQMGVLPERLPWDNDSALGMRNTATAPQAMTVALALTHLEDDFWQGKVRTSAAQRTWDRLAHEVRRLPQHATLTTDLLVAVANTTAAGSRSRLESCKVLKRLGKLVGLEGVEQLDAIRTPYEPAERDLPGDDLLEELVKNIGSHTKYGWATWALITYGCRPAEVFSLQPAGDGTAKVLSVKRKGKQPTWRTALALPVSAEQPERSVPWDVGSPSEYDSLVAMRLTQSWGKWLQSSSPGLQLYALRHSWAVRSVRKNLNASLAAKCMGHSLAVHHSTYHRWLEQADVAAAAKLIQQSRC